MAHADVADMLLGEGLARIAREVDAGFDRLLAMPQDSRARLVEAMRYAAIGGGKRLRPLLLTATSDMYGVDRQSAVRAGLAVEAIHVYSLIHDDLPCMDDDELRHGKPTVHRAFDEARGDTVGTRSGAGALAGRVAMQRTLFAGGRSARTSHCYR